MSREGGPPQKQAREASFEGGLSSVLETLEAESKTTGMVSEGTREAIEAELVRMESEADAEAKRIKADVERTSEEKTSDLADIKKLRTVITQYRKYSSTSIEPISRVIKVVKEVGQAYGVMKGQSVEKVEDAPREEVKDEPVVVSVEEEPTVEPSGDDDDALEPVLAPDAPPIAEVPLKKDKAERGPTPAETAAAKRQKIEAEVKAKQEALSEIYFALADEIHEAGLKVQDIQTEWNRVIEVRERLNAHCEKYKGTATRKLLDKESEELFDEFTGPVSEGVRHAIARVLLERSKFAANPDADSRAEKEDVLEDVVTKLAATEDQPIVMVNTVLTRMAMGGKSSKKLPPTAFPAFQPDKVQKLEPEKLKTFAQKAARHREDRLDTRRRIHGIRGFLQVAGNAGFAGFLGLLAFGHNHDSKDVMKPKAQPAAGSPLNQTAAATEKPTHSTDKPPAQQVQRPTTETVSAAQPEVVKIMTAPEVKKYRAMPKDEMEAWKRRFSLWTRAKYPKGYVEADTEKVRKEMLTELKYPANYPAKKRDVAKKPRSPKESVMTASIESAGSFGPPLPAPPAPSREEPRIMSLEEYVQSEAGKKP
ncbi:MAG: hypothetical protein V4681_02295 [Patescibacteria group bacterium]